MDLCNPKVIHAIMEGAGIRFRHDYGQNFLIDASVPEQIAQLCADDTNTVVMEVGPGIGSLTSELAARYQRVIAVEIDRGLIPVLARTLQEYDNVTVVQADVMKLNLREFLSEQCDGKEIGKDLKVSVCANLPYYITTPILMMLLESHIPFTTITVMIQKEVAARLTAAPGSSEYGAITAVLGYYGTVRKLFSVPHTSFMPAPKVDSAVVRIDLYKESPYVLRDRQFFFGMMRGSFEMRRKTLVNAVNAKYPKIAKGEIVSALNQMGLREDIRGERLSTAEFATLSNILYSSLEK